MLGEALPASAFSALVIDGISVAWLLLILLEVILLRKIYEAADYPSHSARMSSQSVKTPFLLTAQFSNSFNGCVYTLKLSIDDNKVIW